MERDFLERNCIASSAATRPEVFMVYIAMVFFFLDALVLLASRPRALCCSICNVTVAGSSCLCCCVFSVPSAIKVGSSALESLKSDPIVRFLRQLAAFLGLLSTVAFHCTCREVSASLCKPG